jgi:predicted ATP-binding protein involved in virulence
LGTTKLKIGEKPKMNTIFIKKIHIKQVRHLHDIEIELDKENHKHLILTGKNGSGKTSILEVIREHLSYIENKNMLLQVINAKDNLKIFKNGIRNIEKELINNNNPASIVEKNTKIDQYHTSIITQNTIIEKYEKKLIADLNWLEAANLFNDNNLLLAFFASKRQTSVQKSPGPRKLDLPEKNGFSSQFSSHFMQYLVNKRTEKSYANDDNDTKTVEEITAWFNRFQNYLKRIFNDETLELIFDRKNFIFNFKTKGKESFSFNTLSDGYSAILNIVVDLILRMESSHSKNYDMQGIVLIDELETHLHIDLQKQALPFLCEFFPNIQFIITTHSPFILNSISNAVIYDLEKNIRLEDASAYAYDGLIQGYFENDKYSTKIKNELLRYKSLTLDKKRTESEQHEMINLRQKLKSVPNDLAIELVTDFNMFEIERKAAI